MASKDIHLVTASFIRLLSPIHAFWTWDAAKGIFYIPSSGTNRSGPRGLSWMIRPFKNVSRKA